MTDEAVTTATTFWSYAHSDDDEGQIWRLKEKLDQAYKRHRGEAIASFFDRTGDHRIEWGEEWRSKISTTIFGTTFFIPVISPSYLKSSMCREEFDEFAEKAQTSDLNELIMPILWVHPYPETDEEQRIFDVARARQWVDWTQVRKLDESVPACRNLVDQMGERLAKVAREVSNKSEAVSTPGASSTPADGDENGNAPRGVPTQIEEPPGLLDLAVEVTERSEAMTTLLQETVGALNSMRNNVSFEPLRNGASPGQRLFYTKRLANEMTPYAEDFERKAKQTEEAARLLNKTVFNTVDLLKAPQMPVSHDRDETLERLREVPRTVQSQLAAINSARSQISAIGRLSRDLRVPFAAIERGFDSLDAILQLVEDWSAALRSITSATEDDSGSPDSQTK
ncbi:hypothetical protein LAUMK191_05573 [Mycobacterium attenuatum]|uniref:toll/interleukin-1 receptor domain-containing protein n=1 Tax=Mycobacterium attenuatum TaxID=2341086 RepID=UPI000F293BF7|nr:toll/interleukin-1 receptor domain-containing protein [Mycobacterium attenuatum]VBA60545.1 hypothetical protein LAUMK191_05573 [Mycobacterium attenuatum]